MVNMIVKFNEKQLHEGHLTSVFNHVWQYKIRPNLEKYTIKNGIFLGFY